MRAWKFLLPGLTALVLTGCASYHLGGSAVGTFADDKSVEILPFNNQTLQPRLGDAVTQSLRERVQIDGTFHLATAGQGGPNLTPFAAEHLPYMNPGFAQMTTPALVIAGDQDEIPRKYQLTVRGPDWMTEPYSLSPGRKSLLTLFGAEHSLGGIPGYEVKETTDESPERVALIQQVTWAYLRHALNIEDSSWQAAQKVLAESPLGQLESK